MSEYDWETVEVPRGAFIGWGTREGQHVTGKVLTYSPTGGRDFDNNPVPQIAIELIEKAASFSKDGERTDYPAGDLVNMNIGQMGLKAAILRAAPEPGDLIKITLTGTSKSSKGFDVKNFDLKIARGAGQTKQPRNGQQAPAYDPEPPF
jgi:hypothetical protein